ncbi:CDGSH iron-sulfur domain-containing protein [Solicola sp. PLA-1-18]|uniref:CDGSH iron-sulfur domain-containing protein n=1 Tax=Solicola sp. PLA-1-18 TaxID=3380532 RepID=UPI003B76C042
MSDVPRALGADVRTQVCPGGPLLVRGAEQVVAVDGSVHEVLRPVVALCRCAVSTRAPWCDGAHKMLPPARRPGADA